MTIEPKKLKFSCTSDEFRVVVQGCGVKVEIGADGKVTLYSNSETRQPAPTLAAGASAGALKVGAAMPDGTIYAGVSPDTGKPMYATPKDAPMHCNFNQASDYAGKLDSHGRRDWRVPTKAELNVLFGNRAAMGGFDTMGSDPAGWYWSSSRFYNLAWAQRFSDGNQFNRYRNFASSLRCVRG
jgi:hypothetical protein